MIVRLQRMNRKSPLPFLRKWNRCFAYLCVTALCLTTASAHSHPGDIAPIQPTVSSWAQDEVTRASELGLAPAYGLPMDYRTSITREQFRSVSMEFVALQMHCDSSNLSGLVSLYLGEQDADGHLKRVFTDGSEEDSVAYYLGLVEGRGNKKFDPQGYITRQEAAVMLARAYTVCGGTLPTQTAKSTFPDRETIADWAQDSVSALATWKVINGMEDGSFAPNGFYSIEQCLVTFLRLSKNAPVSREKRNVTPLFTYEQGLQYVSHVPHIKEMLRVEGPVATLVELKTFGIPTTSVFWAFVYQDGGVHTVDIGVCMTPYLFPKLDNPRFSDDGKTFYCTVTLAEDQLVPANGQMLHKKGIYHIAVDVDTCRYQITEEYKGTG
ncbi:MAG: S-layer homology domain-containing protein [Clostridia bacterium]|nr:S-layer homology domain-containing protein [Clostridia bacterium]